MDTATAPAHPDEHQDVTDTGAPSDGGAPPSGGHRFTLTSAAEATGTSKRTILRHIDNLTRHGATKDDTGAWSIPLAALLAAGFRVGAPRTSDTDQHAPTRAPGALDDDRDALRAELQRVRAELTEAQHRAALAAAERAAAVALAAERAAHIDSLRLALRQLTAAPEPAPTAPERAPHDAEPPQRVGWWHRLIHGS